MKEIIEIIGVEKLNDKEKEIINYLSEKYHQKLQRQVKNISKIKIQIKEYHINNNNKEYSLNVSVVLEHRKFEADSSGWDFSIVIKKAFEKIINEIEHNYHTSDTHKAKRITIQ